MRTLILIFSIFFFSSSSAQDISKYGFATITKNQCENIDKAFKYTDEFIKYIETNAPKSIYMKCGNHLDGKPGCLIMAESYEAYEEYLSWGETDETWNQLIRQAWKECGIDDFGYGSESLILYNRKDISLFD